jgi:hypothetical protein
VRALLSYGYALWTVRWLPIGSIFLVDAHGWCEKRAPSTNIILLTIRRTRRAGSWYAIKARWACEQARQQPKYELGPDHYEGKYWLGLHHHALPTMTAFTYLLHWRLLSAS